MSNPGTPAEQKHSFRKSLLLALAVLALVVTGCPHNDYMVLLTPDGDGIGRTLDFYCADGVNSNNQPGYVKFSPAELDAITALYPAGAVTNDDLRYTARGEFTNQLPADVGGAGTYTHYPTSLGEAGFYAERFRGNDDFGGTLDRRFKAADRLDDLLLGWSQAELGKEPGYEQLRQFLDTDLRRDLKNVGAYWWSAELAGEFKTNAPQDFMVRVGQYLWERGYFKIEDIPAFAAASGANDSKWLMARVQWLVADKMGVPKTGPVPASLAFLDSETNMEASLTNYLSGTNSPAGQNDPEKVFTDIFADMIAFDLFDTPDHLKVRLSLPLPPVHTNGRWDEALRQVDWETDIEGRTNMAHVPFSCYAAWARPDDAFQTNHFGSTVLSGDNLMQYCLWRNGLDGKRGTEWDKFVTGLKPGGNLVAGLDGFRFSDEPEVDATNQPGAGVGPSVYPRELLKGALRSDVP